MYSSVTITTFTTIHSQFIQLKEKAGVFSYYYYYYFSFFPFELFCPASTASSLYFIFSYFIVGMCSSCFSFSRLLILLVIIFLYPLDYMKMTAWIILLLLPPLCQHLWPPNKTLFFPGPSGVRVHAHRESATASIYVALLYHSAFLRPVCFLHHFYLCGLIRESPALIIIVVCYSNISVSFRFV